MRLDVVVLITDHKRTESLRVTLTGTVGWVRILAFELKVEGGKAKLQSGSEVKHQL